MWATKTSTERTVDLSARTLELLKKIRAEQQKLALKTGVPLPDSCFLNRRGQPIDQSRLTKCMKGALKRAELPTAHGLYDLRHTYATIALSEGKPPTYVAEQNRGQRRDPVSLVRALVPAAAINRGECRYTN